MRNIIAVDPGLVCGVATYENGHFFTAEVPADELMSFVRDSLVNSSDYWTDLVVENYTITNRTARYTRQDDALRLIGSLEVFANDFGLRFIKQPPWKKNRCSDKTLNRLEIQKTKDGHARDAVRHLIVYGVAWGLFPDATIRKILGKDTIN